MPGYAKGQKTKAHIIKTAQKLFYTQGYGNTSTRQIANESQTGLGLISYYFSGKANIATIIYDDIRKQRIKLLEDLGYQIYTPFFYLLGAAVYFIQLYKNKSYRDFFLSISSEPEFNQLMYNYTRESLKRYMKKDTTEEYYILTCATIVNTTPAILNAVNDPKNQISLEASLRYYLTNHILFWGEDPALCERVMEESRLLYVDMADNFTSIITKLN